MYHHQKSPGAHITMSIGTFSIFLLSISLFSPLLLSPSPTAGLAAVQRELGEWLLEGGHL